MHPAVEKIRAARTADLDGPPPRSLDTAPREADVRPTDAGQDADYHYTDLGNAARLVDRHGRNLRHCQELGWLVWTGMRYEIDAGEVLVGREAEETVRSLYAEAATLSDKSERETLATHAKQCESERRIQAMIAAAKRGQGIPIRPEQLDADPFKLTCRNGTLDLRSGVLGPHRRDDLITKLAPVAYDPGAACPLWKQFLNTIMNGDDAMVGFLQRALGYSLTADTREQHLFIPHGLGANGKTTLFSVFQTLLADYAAAASADLLLVRRHDGDAPHELADLRGARFVWLMESGEGRRLNESLIKALTGGDPIRARRLYRDGFTFTPTAKFWMPTNHRPIVKGTDAAIWRRLLLIPFAVTIPVSEQDKTLTQKLKAELPGILAWCANGCVEWQRRGLDPPNAVKTATQDYRSEMDLVAAFIADSCVEEPSASVLVGDLYRAYVEWAEHAGEQPMTQRMLAMRLQEQGYVRKQSGRRAWWGGLRLRLPGESDALVAPSTADPVQENIDLEN